MSIKRVRPDLRGLGRIVTSAPFSQRKCVKTVTWNSRDNFEDFLIAEANHVQIQASAR